MRVALVGCGVHAQRILLPVLQLLGARLTAVVDPVAERRVAVAERVGAQPLESIEGLTLRPDADAILIATPPSVSPRIVSGLLSLGVPLFVEKPAGTSSAEVGDLAARAEASGVPVQVGFMKRFAPAYRQVRQISRSWGKIALQGRLTVGEYAADEEFLTDVAVHAFDLVRYLLGDVRLLAVDRVGESGQSTWQALLGSERGSCSLVLSSRGSWGNPAEHWWAEGAGESLSVENLVRFCRFRRGRISSEDDVAKRLPDVGILSWEANFSSSGVTHQSQYLQGYVGELEAFFQTVQMGVPPQVGLRDAQASLELAEQLLARGGR